MADVSPNRPRSVTITAVAVSILGLLNGWRAAALARDLDLLDSLALSLDPRLRLAGALFWLVATLVTAVALWQRRSWSRWAAPLLVALYGLYQLALLALFVEPAARQQGWPGDLAWYVTAVLLTTWALNRTAVRPYFTGPPAAPEPSSPSYPISLNPRLDHDESQH